MGAPKDRAEAEWKQALGEFWREQRDRIKAKLEPRIPKSRKSLEELEALLGDEFWDTENEQLMAVLAPLLSEATTEAADTFEDQIQADYGLGLDWTLINTEAAKWVRSYGFGLVKGINKTTAKRLQGVVGAFVETPGMTMGDLFTKLERLPAFNQRRAQLVAVTEVTRAYSEGTLITAREYEKEGYFTWAKTWQTNNDDLVCPICRPLHGQAVEGVDAEYTSPAASFGAPPAHPGCRCWTTLEPLLEGEVVPKPGLEPAVEPVPVVEPVPAGPQEGTAEWARQRVAEVAKEVDARIAELDRQTDASYALSNSISELMDQTVVESEIAAYRAERIRLRKMRMAMIFEKSDLQMERNQRLRAFIEVDNPATFKVDRKGTRWKKTRREAFEEGTEAFRKLVGTGTMESDVTVRVKTTTDARAYNQRGTVYVGKHAGARTMVHELGHSLEHYDPVVHRKALAFLKKRTKGERTKWLGDRFDPHEKTRKDKFLDPYMGKDYGTSATEIVSMGVEYMYNKPLELARDDPEYFDFIYDLLRGR